MAGQDFNTAMTNRSLRTIKAELEFLADAGSITPATLSTILSQLPEQPGARAPSLDNRMSNLAVTSPPMQPQQPQTNGYTPYSEKQQFTPQPSPSPAVQPPPPAYPVAPSGPPPLCYATALYAYSATDAGDLTLAPNERVAVTEYMNSEWWKGRSEKTGMEGIFPSSYVRTEEKIPPTPQPGAQPSNYGNMMVDVSQSGGSSNPQAPNKGAEMGKKFGKKLGNAAIFGAGATIGGNIVNGIF